MEVMITLMAMVFGAIFGSFACCQAWRLRYWIQGKDDLGDWSICMYCKHRLAWYDNIPLISWITLRGRCRYCRRKIGSAEILSEIGMALTGAVAAWLYIIPLVNDWNAGGMDGLQLAMRIVEIVVVVFLLVGLAVLAVYDGKWGELPTRLLWMCIACAVLIALLGQENYYLANGELDWGAMGSTLGGVLILAGTCYVLYKVSNETLMGGGDWMMALALALVLGDWWLALWVMMAANLLGSIIMAPVAIVKKRATIHFGPFLAMAFVIVMAGQEFLQGLI